MCFTLFHNPIHLSSRDGTLISISLFVTSQFLVLPPLTLFLAYGMPISCLPRVPVCLNDDAFSLALFWLPRHIPWPESMVSEVNRVPFAEFPWFMSVSAEVVDCKTQGS